MEIIKITKDNFEKEVKEAKTPVIVDFWATWCGPCMMQGPVMEEIADGYDSIRVGKVNVDEEQELAMRFGITSIPTIICFRNGEAAETLIGLHTKEEIADKLGL